MASYKVLYIEDNDDNFRLVQRILSRWGCEIDRAKTAASGIQRAQELAYDVILTDILLPDSSIQEAQSKLLLPLRQQVGSQVPLVALTAHAFPFDKTFLLENGCNYFLAKPININEFQALINKLLPLELQDKAG